MGKFRLAIFISGKGSNALNIIKYFKGNDAIEVALVLSNKTGAEGLKNAQKMGVDTIVFNNETFKKSGEIDTYLRSLGIDFIVLAGFLRQIPIDLVDSYKNKIINIHPSLLPKFGGKGMFGTHVHKAVLDNNEVESGISIHYVSNEYDEGKIIFQKSIAIDEGETINSLSKKIQQLEHTYFPLIIEKTIRYEFNT
ncbi:MAG: phosphoribosylglycinamide formyltransferase [Flavobacteriales bacterium]|nr:phosphoribosylglycinamide formyltransferase [Flavobacteriales bacterium]